MVPVQHTYTVNVCSYRAEERKAVRVVCETVPVQQEVTVNVCSYRTEERKGVRIVCETVQEQVMRTVRVCEMQPYTQMVRVPMHVAPDER
jgi:hypothetical protein